MIKAEGLVKNHITYMKHLKITSCHPQVFQSPTSDDCLKIIFYDHTEPQLITKNLFQVSVKEPHNSLVSYPNYSGLKDARYEENNIIIGDSTFFSLLPHQLKQISEQYKVVCGCECCVSDKSINSSLLSWRDRYLKN